MSAQSNSCSKHSSYIKIGSYACVSNGSSDVIYENVVFVHVDVVVLITYINFVENSLESCLHIKLAKG